MLWVIFNQKNKNKNVMFYEWYVGFIIIIIIIWEIRKF